MPKQTESLISQDQADRMMQTRIDMLIRYPWFGQLSMQLTLMEDTSLQTMATDGTRLFYNPTFTPGEDDEQMIGDQVHEVMHCAMKHIWRLADYPPHIANLAGDYAINPIILKCGLKLTKGALYDERFDGMFAEQIAAILMHEEEQGKKLPQPQCDMKFKGGDEQSSDSGDDQSDEQQSEPGEEPGEEPSGSQPGEEPGEESGNQAGGGQPDMTEFDWEIAADQATQTSRGRGLMPGHLEQYFKDSLKPTVPWQQELREFVDNTAPSDYAWNPPNRNYVMTGMYLPSVRKENTPRIDIIADTSGSTGAYWHQFFSEVTSVMLEARPTAVRVILCDTEVRDVHEFTPDDGEIDTSVFRATGGGTDMQPAFDWIAEQDEQPAAIICMTDLEIGPVRDPEIPVLWVAPAYCYSQPPDFGRLVTMA